MKQLQALTDEQIRKVAPSVFATTRHESRTERFTPIPTINVVNGLREEGFFPTSVMQSLSRTPGKAAYTKHLIRFCQEQHMGLRALQQEVPEIWITNANDGTSAYVVKLGIIRLVCLNGMTRSDDISTMRVRHQGNIVDGVIEATYKIAEEAEPTLNMVAQMKQITLSYEDQYKLAQAALRERFGDEVVEFGRQVEGTLAHDPQEMLARRRPEDRGNDLWTVTNVIQEHAMRGGVNNLVSHRVSKPVKGINQTLTFNERLWQFADTIRKIKVGE